MMFIVTKETLNALVTARVSAELAKHGVVVENLVLDDVTAGLEEKRIVKKLESKKKKEVEVTTATIDLFDELDSKAAVPAPVLAEAKKKGLDQDQKEQAKLQKEQEKAAKEQAKQEKQALAEAKEKEKLAKKALADAKEQEKKALADAKEQEKLAKEQAKLAKEQEKAAKKALAEQKEQAKLLKEQAKAAKASPAVVEKKDEEEEEEDVVNKFEFMGTMYLKSKKTGQIYNMDQDPVGMWNEKTKKIDFDEEGEEFEE